MVLHLQMQGLVVDPEESRRRTLVPVCGLKGQTNRPSLRLGCGLRADLLQGGVHLVFEHLAHSGNSQASEKGDSWPARGPELSGAKRTDGSINRSDRHAAYERVTTATTPGTA